MEPRHFAFEVQVRMNIERIQRIQVETTYNVSFDIVWSHEKQLPSVGQWFSDSEIPFLPVSIYTPISEKSVFLILFLSIQWIYVHRIDGVFGTFQSLVQDILAYLNNPFQIQYLLRARVYHLQ